MLLHRSDLNISENFRQTFSHFSGGPGDADEGRAEVVERRVAGVRDAGRLRRRPGVCGHVRVGVASAAHLGHL